VKNEANMTTAVSGRPVRSLLVGFLAFGFLVGMMGGAYVLATGGGVMAAIITYVVAGSLGLVGMAATALWRDNGPRTGPTDGSVPQTSDLTGPLR
jgi:hypothetical protein